MSEQIRLTANVTRSVAAALRYIAAARGVSLTEALRQAVSHEKYRIDAVANGRKRFLLEHRWSGKRRIIEFG